MKFPEVLRDSRVKYRDRPAAAVAHDQDWLLASARGCGLGLDRAAYGSWTTHTRLSMRDIVLFRVDR